MNSEELRFILLSLADKQYKAFLCKLMPTVDAEKVLGVRMPDLRKLAKTIENPSFFLESLPHQYYEENNLHGILISQITDYSQVIAALDVFLPYIDNWATCDLISPKAFRKCPVGLLDKVNAWISSGQTYIVRYGIGVLMKYYLENTFSTELLDLVAGIQTKEYYIRMMVAWYFATALAKQYTATIPYLENRRLDDWIHRKTIQKATESYRIPDAQKKYLKSLK